jgi:hypothetical protein
MAKCVENDGDANGWGGERPALQYPCVKREEEGVVLTMSAEHNVCPYSPAPNPMNIRALPMSKNHPCYAR